MKLLEHAHYLLGKVLVFLFGEEMTFGGRRRLCVKFYYHSKESHSSVIEKVKEISKEAYIVPEKHTFTHTHTHTLHKHTKPEPIIIRKGCAR